MKRLFCLCLLISALAPVLSVGDQANRSAISANNAWIPVPPAGAPTAAGYLTLYNHGNDADRLLAASSALAKTVSLHATLMENNVMKMRAQEAVEVPGGGMVELAPGGLHLMFVGLQRTLNEGDTVPVTLSFERAGEISVELTVKPRGAAMSHGDRHGSG